MPEALIAWLWTIPGLISVGLFGFVLAEAWIDRRDAGIRLSTAADDKEQRLWARSRVVATERAITAGGLLLMAVLSSVTGVLTLAAPRSSLAGEIALWSLLAVPWAHFFIGVNIWIGRRRTKSR